MESTVSKSPPSSPPATHDGDQYAASEARVTSRLYLHRPGGAGAMEKDDVLRRISHRRRHNRLRDTLRSLLVVQQQQQQAAPDPEQDGGERRPAAWLVDDSFSSP